MIERALLHEKKTGKIIAKLSAHAAFVYNNVLEGMSNLEVKSQFPDSWKDLVKIKSKYFQALAHYHQSLVLENEKKYGENISHLILSEVLAKEASKLAVIFYIYF